MSPKRSAFLTSLVASSLTCSVSGFLGLQLVERPSGRDGCANNAVFDACAVSARPRRRRTHRTLQAGDDPKAESGDEDSKNVKGAPDSQVEFASDAVIKVDDGGSDLTDRFKYKVQALMGTFDPLDGKVDDERQDGNILNAMLIFPVRYSFNVVGRTPGGDETLRDKFVEQVKEIVGNASGDVDGMELQMTPRGNNFTKLKVEVMVESAAIITNIYDELESLEQTVMRF